VAPIRSSHELLSSHGGRTHNDALNEQRLVLESTLIGSKLAVSASPDDRASWDSV